MIRERGRGQPAATVLWDWDHMGESMRGGWRGWRDHRRITGEPPEDHGRTKEREGAKEELRGDQAGNTEDHGRPRGDQERALRIMFSELAQR